MNELTAKIQAALAHKELRAARRRGTQSIRERVPTALQAYPALAQETRALKERALRQLPRLLDSSVHALLSHGFHVVVAKNGSDACDYVLHNIPPQSLIIKSKSNLAKEIHLPETLEKAGHRVVETDLGDHINQLLGRRSGHVLMPALGVDIPAIQEAFRRHYRNADIGSVPEELVSAARRHLRPILESAQVSISGANAVTASGEIVLMENEGNIRAVTSLPKIHFVIAAVNKIVESLEDGLSVVQAASLYGIGQDLGNYCTVLAGPGRDAGPEVHVVLVDDGRLAQIEKEPEPFYCINCGSCLNVCPVYAELGEQYGGERLGGIGIMQTFLLDGEETATRDGLDLCLGCQRCVPACPVHIDTPAITNRLKAARRVQPTNPLRRRLLALVLSRRDLSWSRPLLKSSAILGFSRRWHRRGILARDFVPIPDSAPPLSAALYPAKLPARGQVWLFPGCVMDGWFRQIHWDTIRLLNANGYSVQIPADHACCGALHEHAGVPGVVSDLMDRQAQAFSGEDLIIVNSAGCGAFLKQHPNPVSSRVRDLSEFLWEQGLKPVPPPVGRTAAYHNPCHLAYAQHISDAPRALLKEVGYQLTDVTEQEACCGSAGTYNLEFPELAWRLAREKADDLLEGAPDLVITANPGCLMQIRAGVEAQGSKTAVVHLATALWAAYREKRA